MSADEDISIAVKAEGVDDAANDLSSAQAGGVPVPSGSGQDTKDGKKGGIRGNLKSGIIAGLLVSLLGPLLDVLDPMLKILDAFLAPLAAFLLRLFQPVLRFFLTKILPIWLEFFSIAIDGIPALQRLLIQLPMRIWNFVSGLAQKIWTAFSNGASWLINGARNIGSEVWKSIKTGANWLTNGATSIGKAIWNNADKTLQDLWDVLNVLSRLLVDLPGDIWEELKQLPKKIANEVTNVATGGIVSQPTLGAVAEDGPEAVIPLDRLESMMGQNQDSTNVQISGGLAPFVQKIERSPDIDL